MTEIKKSPYDLKMQKIEKINGNEDKKKLTKLYVK